ncbi:hypothetical protein [Streptomyces sp. NPDC101115]|uniref:hypothetical protein n=1 Tax=Streptomyces sp. NPDC101115 TaxID=3366106 RepID=UPI003824A8D3
MTTTDLHDLLTSEGGDGTVHLAERLWTHGQDPVVLGFTPVLGGLHIIGLPAPYNRWKQPITPAQSASNRRVLEPVASGKAA